MKTQARDSQGDVFVETHYDLLGCVERVTNPYRSGEIIYWSKTRYDAAGRAVETYAPATVAEINTSATNNNANLTSLGVTSFDISTVNNASGNFVGTVVTTKDASGRRGRSITNALGQLIRVDEPTGINGTDADADLGSLTAPFQATSYKYDVFGKMVQVTQGVQNRYFKYDALGRLLRVRQPEQEVNPNLATSGNPGNDAWTAGFAYDLLGNVVRATDANGVNIINDYDRAGRVVRRCYTKPNINTTATTCAPIIGTSSESIDTPSVTLWYDGKGLTAPQDPNFAKGKLTKVSSSVSATEYQLFDSFGRVTQAAQITDGNTYTSRYTYSFSGALVEEEYPSGRKVTNEFEPDGDLAKVTSKKNSTSVNAPFVSNFSYTASGGISQMKLGNGRWETAKFNNRMQVTELGLGASASDAGTWKTQYEYGELNSNGTVDTAKNTGNIAKQTLSFNSIAHPLVQSYKYDALYRITEATETANSVTNWFQVWGYDRYGNRTSFTQNIGGNPASSNPSIDANTNRFNTGQGFAFDKNGNIITDVSTDNFTRNFVFNGDNKQTEVKKNGVTVGRYFYDGEGKRVKKISDLETTIFVYSSGKLVAEYSTATPPASPSVNYTTTDHLGTPRIITDQFGQVQSRRDFLPFGEEVTINVGARSTALKYGSSDDKVRQKFTGYQKDTETSLDFAEARMYDNRFGRFTAVDPLLASGRSANPQTFNRYVYVLNNPIVFRDVDGRIPVYFHEFPDGKIHWTTDQSYAKNENYKRFEGKQRIVKGDDGRNYLIRPNGIFAAKRSSSTVPPTSSSIAAKPEAQTGYVNHKLVKVLADEGAKKQTIMFAAAGSGVVLGSALGGCIALCGPAAAYASIYYAPIHASTPWVTYFGTFGFTFGVGVAGEKLVNGQGESSEQNESEDIPNIYIDGRRHPTAAKHAFDAQQMGYPSVLTIDRPGRNARSRAALSPYPTLDGFQRDEYPPAVFLEGGVGASVRYIDPFDNEGAGGSMGQQMKRLPNGQRIRIVPLDP